MDRLPAGWRWREPVDSEPNPVSIQPTATDDARLLQHIAWRDRQARIRRRMLKLRDGLKSIA